MCDQNYGGNGGIGGSGGAGGARAGGSMGYSRWIPDDGRTRIILPDGQVLIVPKGYTSITIKTAEAKREERQIGPGSPRGINLWGRR